MSLFFFEGLLSLWCYLGRGYPWQLGGVLRRSPPNSDFEKIQQRLRQNLTTVNIFRHLSTFLNISWCVKSLPVGQQQRLRQNWQNFTLLFLYFTIYNMLNLGLWRSYIFLQNWKISNGFQDMTSRKRDVWACFWPSVWKNDSKKVNTIFGDFWSIFR